MKHSNQDRAKSIQRKRKLAEAWIKETPTGESSISANMPAEQVSSLIAKRLMKAVKKEFSQVEL